VRPNPHGLCADNAHSGASPPQGCGDRPYKPTTTIWHVSY